MKRHTMKFRLKCYIHTYTYIFLCIPIDLCTTNRTSYPKCLLLYEIKREKVKKYSTKYSCTRTVIVVCTNYM